MSASNHIARAYALAIFRDRFAHRGYVAMTTAHHNTCVSSITRRHLPPHCSRISQVRPKGANAGTPLGLSGTTSGNPANGATAANANNAGNNGSTNRVNVEIFYVHPDHLGTSRVVTRSTIATGANAPVSTTATSPGAINKAVWRWDSDPFGTSLGTSTPTENPQVITGTATVIQAATLKQNLRFPGQTNDARSGKYYNYFRDHDASIGRYVESDPIGLRGALIRLVM